MRRVWILIGVLTLIALVIFGNRIWNIRFLYLRSDVRADLVTVMKAANDVNGWSASDLDLHAITCPGERSCVFTFAYQYRDSHLERYKQLMEVWVENNSVQFEDIYE